MSSYAAPPEQTTAADCYSDLLSDAQLQLFHEQGYLIFPAWIPPADIAQLKEEIDHFNASATLDPYHPSDNPKVGGQLSLPGHWELATHPSLMALVGRILGPGFAHHHLHTAKHVPGDKGVAWHHDYDQHPQTNRSHGMVHTFWYLNGLDGTIGDLLVLPGSQNMVIERNSLSRWGFAELPGTVRVDDLPPGSLVIVHSAVLHARAPKAGGDLNKPRYFIDSSYCQAGVRWPHTTGWLKAHALALSSGRAAAAGVEHLFQPEHFLNVDHIDWTAFHHVNQGSLLPRLLGN